MSAGDRRGTGSRSEISRGLGSIAARPLRLCPEFPAIARRWESWWDFRADRPLLVASAPLRPEGLADKALQHLRDPERWLEIRVAQVEATHYVGETVPWVRVDLGPVATAAFLGSDLRIAAEEQTAWQNPTLRDLRDVESLAIDSAGWYGVARSLLRRLAPRAAGSFLICLPDLAGAVDVLASLRGAERLCLDVAENPVSVRRAASRIVEHWATIYSDLHRTALQAGAGVVQWLGCWSGLAYTIPTCDFSALLGPADFRVTCLPSLVEQARRVSRCVFHLDGPDAARHADMLAAEPSITAIQYTPGAGTPSAVAKLPLLRSIQRAGKPLYLFCPADEVERLSGELDPRGLALAPEGISTPDQADRLLRAIGG